MPIQIARVLRSRRKTIALLVRSDGTLEVRAPSHLSEAYIRDFVQEHAEWIRRQQLKALKAAPPAPKQFVDGTRFLYLGEEHCLRIVSHQRQALAFDGKEFKLLQSALPLAREAFIRWYQIHAKHYLFERVQILAKRYGYEYSRIRISSARTRWGSCSSRGSLSFTYRLVMAPPDVVDCVIIHELVHLKIKNHSKDFWGQVATHIPDYKKSILYMKKNGRLLTLE